MNTATAPVRVPAARVVKLNRESMLTPQNVQMLPIAFKPILSPDQKKGCVCFSTDARQLLSTLALQPLCPLVDGTG